MSKNVLPRQSIIRFIFVTTFAVAILEILNVLATSMPAQIILLRQFLGIYHDFHAHLIKVIQLILI